jgi:hypothetical protein
MLVCQAPSANLLVFGLREKPSSSFCISRARNQVSSHLDSLTKSNQRCPRTFFAMWRRERMKQPENSKIAEKIPEIARRLHREHISRSSFVCRGRLKEPEAGRMRLSPAPSESVWPTYWPRALV